MSRLALSHRHKLRQGHCKCQSLSVLLGLLCPDDIFVLGCEKYVIYVVRRHIDTVSTHRCSFAASLVWYMHS
jgi:hypothetical protein